MSKATIAHSFEPKSIADIASQIGNTKLLPLEFLSTDTVSVFAKCEWQQLSGSVKARAAYSIVSQAFATDQLGDGKTLLDASSGNTAIAYGSLGKLMNFDVTICLPKNASIRRIEMLRDLGVEIEFTSPFEGTEGAQSRAREMAIAAPHKYYYADQYSNEANWKAHYDGTANEILQQTNRSITHFVAGLGTTGTFTGTSRRLQREVNCTCISLQPDTALHIMEGWKHMETADVPSIYNDKLADENIFISSEEVINMMKTLESELNIRLSPSSAANVVGAARVMTGIKEGVIVTVLPDTIDRYHEIEKQIFSS